MNPSVDVSQLPLRDIHLPAPVGWWPPAPGWWFLALLALAGLAYAGLIYYRRRSHRSALKAIARVAAALDAGEEPARCVQVLSTVLRRFAMTLAAAPGRSPASGGPAVAGLTGRRWLEYLDARWTRADFCGPGAALAHAPYAPPARVRRDEARELARLCRDWVKAQRR
ncbi:MAG TPA: DUF4381 domain-containing protein [Gammaproteobacteria bacterium]|nr:DUF4381 domain-containing protein [Gammaproteobacteria bacterium]